MRAIRPLYDEFGVDGFYRDHAGAYENPHFPEIQALVTRNFERIDCTHVLDFAAGGGEVTRILTGLGATHITGCDPYTQQLFVQNTGRPCLSLSFKSVIREGLPGQYSTIICSFALHLCPVKALFPLVWNLLEAAPTLVVITPHKRPDLDAIDGVRLLWEDSVRTARAKTVRCRAYQRTPG